MVRDVEPDREKFGFHPEGTGGPLKQFSPGNYRFPLVI